MRRAGARVCRVGLRAAASALPDGPLVSFGLAGALGSELRAGDLVTAQRIVDERARTLWVGEGIALAGALEVVLLAADRMIDDPGERLALAERTGAHAVDMESAELAASGRLVGAVKVVSDTPGRPVGLLAAAAHPDGSVAWPAVLRAFAKQPATAVRAARDARRGLDALERAAARLAE